LEGLPDKAAGIKRPYVRETEMALRSAWQNFAEDALLEGHTGTVLDAAYSPNGQRIVTAHRKSNGAVVGCQNRQADCGSEWSPICCAQRSVHPQWEANTDRTQQCDVRHTRIRTRFGVV
jgi:hypothetical protein